MPVTWHPKWLADLYHKVAPWHFLIFGIGEVLALVFGEFYGRIVGYTIGIAVLLAWLMLPLTEILWQPVTAAIGLLSKDSNNAENLAAAKDLRATRRKLGIAVIAIAIAFVLVLIPSLSRGWHLLRARTPERIGFATLTYYQPKEEEESSEEPAFVQALVTLLRQEGQAAGSPYRILWGETQPIEHFTPEFDCVIEIARGKYNATGYVFRLHEENAHRVYEPIPASYADPKKVVLKIPRSQMGDRFFMVARIDSPKEPTFPDNPTEETILRVIKSEKAP